MLRKNLYRNFRSATSANAKIAEAHNHKSVKQNLILSL
jgi:hypothetical protein